MIAIILSASLALAEGSNIYTVEEAKLVSWGGGHTDPLTTLVNWDVNDPSICWASSAQAGWSNSMYRATITNNDEQPIKLAVSGAIVDIVDSPVAGAVQLPYMVISTDGYNTSRSTILDPGETCFLNLPYQEEKNAVKYGWSVRATSLAHRSVVGQWLPAGSAYLYTAGLWEGASHTDQVFYRKWQPEITIIFDNDDF